jgi:hypothetical protein
MMNLMDVEGAVGMYFKPPRGPEKNRKEKPNQDNLLAEKQNEYNPNRKQE